MEDSSLNSNENKHNLFEFGRPPCNLSYSRGLISCLSARLHAKASRFINFVNELQLGLQEHIVPSIIQQYYQEAYLQQLHARNNQKKVHFVTLRSIFQDLLQTFNLVRFYLFYTLIL